MSKKRKYFILALDPNSCFVYEYFRPDDWTCFYVGMGSSNRHKDIARRSQEFIAIVNELEAKGMKPFVKIRYDKLSKQIALVLEQERIRHFIKRGDKLVNKNKNRS